MSPRLDGICGIAGRRIGEKSGEGRRFLVFESMAEELSNGGNGGEFDICGVGDTCEVGT